MGYLRILNESGDTTHEFSDPKTLRAAEALLQRYLRAGHLAFDHTKHQQTHHLAPDSNVVVVPEVRVG